MSEISPRPWKLVYDNIFDANGEKILGLREWRAQDLCHAINCVNQHIRLKEKISIMQIWREQNLETIEKLKQLLKKCSPISIEDYWNGNEYEKLEYCIFCPEWKIYGRHADNCEYIKMIGGSEE